MVRSPPALLLLLSMSLLAVCAALGPDAVACGEEGPGDATDTRLGPYTPEHCES
jgi:hypothetical protein